MKITTSLSVQQIPSKGTCNGSWIVSGVKCVILLSILTLFLYDLITLLMSMYILNSESCFLPGRMKSNIFGMEGNMDQLLQKVF